MFTLGLLFTLLFNLLGWQIAKLANFVLAVIILLIFFHAWWKNKSVKIAFLSVIAAFTQLTAYGIGFMQDFWKRIILNRS
jgi:riboflavin transporter FmnP